MNYIVLDIETGRAPDEDIAYKVMQLQPPKSVSDKGKTAAGKWLQEKQVEIESKANLYDTSPIEVIGLMINTQVIVLTTIDVDSIENIAIQTFQEEKALLQAFSLLTDNYEPEETVMITQNGLGFDLRRIRCRCGYFQLPQPAIFACEQYDIMKRFSYDFSMERTGGFIKLGEICQALGIEHGKTIGWKEAYAKYQAGDRNRIFSTT